MNRFKKVGDDWQVFVTSPAQAGDTVTVTLSSGATKQVVLGQHLGGAMFATAPRAAAPKVVVGNLDGIIALFDRAAKHLKFPAVVLNVPGMDGVRVSRAGSRAKLPGTLNVTSAQKDDSEYGRTWYGRVTLDGQFSPSRDAIPAIATALAAFAADPAKVATEYGRLTGICCFCRKALTDERSTAVGYGKICAGHYGLPWGATEVKTVAQEDAELAQRELQAEQMSRDEQQAHFASATDGSYDGQEDYQNAARRERLTGYWSPRNRARYQD